MKIYLVGGAVRDQLLNFPYHEKDWVVIGSSPEEMIQLGYTPVGKDFPVFLHPKSHEEYALARTERKTAPGYKGFTFHTDTHVTLEEDLERRDLTINAMAKDDTGNIIDPYHGKKDLEEKCLRHVSAAFSEDPVRVLRVARFAARYHYLGFHVAKETMSLMQSMAAQGETQHLVAERVWQECQKALSEKSPEVFFNILQDSNALCDIFPGLDHDSIQACTRLLTSTCTLSSNSVNRFSAFCFTLELSKIETLCEYLNTPNEYRELALLTKRHFSACIQPEKWDAETLVTLFQKTDALRKGERFQQLLTTIHGIYCHQKNNDEFKQENLLLEALTAYKNIDHQSLIKQGFQKSALGDAIKAKRRIQLEEWLLIKKPELGPGSMTQ